MGKITKVLLELDRPTVSTGNVYPRASVPRASVVKIVEELNATGEPLYGELGQDRFRNEDAAALTDEVMYLDPKRVAVKITNLRFEVDALVGDVEPVGPLAELAAGLLEDGRMALRARRVNHSDHFEVKKIVAFDLVD